MSALRSASGRRTRHSGHSQSSALTRSFVQLACGHIDPQAQIDAGLVSWTGNAELGDRAARNLRYTM